MKVFYSSFSGAWKKDAEWTNWAKNKAFACFSVTRRRTKVRREAKFVYSIKHKIYSFCVCFKLYVLKGFSELLISKKPFICLVLCGLRVFYSPFFCFWKQKCRIFRRKIPQSAPATSRLQNFYLNFILLSLRALLTTQKLERLIAAAPSMGFSSQPKMGVNTPAARGIQSAL